MARAQIWSLRGFFRVFASLTLVAFFGVLAAACDGSGGAMAITDLQPRKGVTTGGQKVVISGQNFRTDIGYTVYFGAKRATAVTIIDPETLLAETPAIDKSGVVDVTVRADNGDAFKISNVYEVAEAGGAAQQPAGNLKF
ncbi:MAG: IPT/TIG domain-containing protein [Myxococcales bacterium]|nr:IPT/TIG domain-containing protein [Myxococcales bacterium]